MQPDARDARGDAVGDDALGHRGRGGDHHTIEPLRNRRDVGIAAITLDLAGVGIDGKDLVAGRAQTPIDQVGGLLGVAGDAGHREMRLGEELFGGFTERRHSGRSFQANRVQPQHPVSQARRAHQ